MALTDTLFPVILSILGLAYEYPAIPPASPFVVIDILLNFLTLLTFNIDPNCTAIIPPDVPPVLLFIVIPSRLTLSILVESVAFAAIPPICTVDFLPFKTFKLILLKLEFVTFIFPALPTRPPINLVEALTVLLSVHVKSSTLQLSNVIVAPNVVPIIPAILSDEVSISTFFTVQFEIFCKSPASATIPAALPYIPVCDSFPVFIFVFSTLHPLISHPSPAMLPIIPPVDVAFDVIVKSVTLQFLILY